MQTEDLSGYLEESECQTLCKKGEITDMEEEKVLIFYLKDEESKAPCVDTVHHGNSSQDCYGEEEWLLEELPHMTEESYGIIDVKNHSIFSLTEETKEFTSQEIFKQDIKAGPSNIIFEDRQLSHADMYICKLCHRVFGNQYKLESHQFRKHNTTEFKKRGRKPKNPKKTNEWPPNVQDLAQRVNGVKVFFCNICSYRVNRCDSMTKHMLRIHRNGRPVPQYQCEVCGKVFVDKAYLRNHSISHVTERVHTCEVCGRGFHRRPSLKRHRQCHLDQKQFTCTLCDYTTNRKHLMYKHAENHICGRAYTCKVCDLPFYTQLAFRSHMYTHNINPNACSFCKVGFSSRERMICHMQKLHFSCETKDMNAELLRRMSLFM